MRPEVARSSVLINLGCSLSSLLFFDIFFFQLHTTHQTRASSDAYVNHDSGGWVAEIERFDFAETFSRINGRPHRSPAPPTSAFLSTINSQGEIAESNIKGNEEMEIRWADLTIRNSPVYR